MSAAVKLHARSDEQTSFDYRRALEIGSAGEHIVCADLLLAGFRAFLASQGSPYDIAVEVDGRLIRVAVKSTMKAKARPAREGSRTMYQFCVTRSKRDNKGKTHAPAYSMQDVDIVALVALDTRSVAYIAMSKCKTSMHFAVVGDTGRTTRFGPKTKNIKMMADYSFSNACEISGVLNAQR